MDRKETGALPCDSDCSQGPPSSCVCARARIRELCQVGDGTKTTRHVPRLPVSALALIFPPGTPKEPVQIIREAMRKTFADPEFPKEFHKLMGDDPAPLGGEELERAIKELP